VSGFLVDTNVLSEFSRRGEPNPKVKNWLKAAAPGSLYVSILTLAELRRGIELLPPGKRRDQLEQWLQTELLESFDDANVLPVWGLRSSIPGEPSNATHHLRIAGGATNGSDWVAPRGVGVRLHSPPFPHMGTKVFCGRPERSRARGLCAFIADP
jgi:hypothetical protein